MSQIPEEILAAAGKIVSRESVDALTMPRLAEAMGISRASLYRQSGGREALLEALGVDTTDTRDRILAGARIVFGRDGFEAASIEEIAAEAKVGVATVYRQFGDKDGLVAAFIDTLAPRRIAREMPRTGDLRADLERLAATMLRATVEDGSIVRLMVLESLRGGKLLQRVRKLSASRISTAVEAMLRSTGAVRADVSAPTLARAFAGMVFAFGVMAPVFRGEAVNDPDATAREIVNTFLDGALARKDQT